MMDLADDGMCFVCGLKNDEGLQLAFELLESEKRIRTRFIPQKKYQGYVNIVHGGIISTVLDEAMVNLACRLGLQAVTAKLEIRFKKPAWVGEPLSIEAEIVRTEGRVIHAKASAANSDGGLVASALGKLMLLER
ncbi:MAG: PaaI family thioesterase [bacterium]